MGQSICHFSKDYQHWCVIYRVRQKLWTFSILFIQNHALLNSVTKLSIKLYKVSNNVFTVSVEGCKHEFQMTKPLIYAFVNPTWKLLPFSNYRLHKLFDSSKHTVEEFPKQSTDLSFFCHTKIKADRVLSTYGQNDTLLICVWRCFLNTLKFHRLVVFCDAVKAICILG